MVIDERERALPVVLYVAAFLYNTSWPDDCTSYGAGEGRIIALAGPRATRANVKRRA